MSNVPPWGCPYHGLIQDSQLTLPNGDTLPCRQPNGFSFERGHTHLVEVPDAPETTRTVAELAEDAASGRQWLDRAMIAGNQVHGVFIGNGAMIYIAPDGSRWLVNASLHGQSAAVTAATVTLRRFGIIGGDLEEYSYAVAVPDLSAECAYHGVQPSVVQVRMFHAHPQGNAAVFGLFARLVNYIEFAALAWLELSLSGPANACVIGVAIVRDAATTDGLATESDDFGFVSQFTSYFVGSSVETGSASSAYPACSGSYRREINYSISADSAGSIQQLSGNPTEGTQTARRVQQGIIIGLLYTDLGALQEVTIEAQLERIITAGALTITSTPYVLAYNFQPGDGVCVQQITQEQDGAATIQQTGTFDTTATLIVRYGGVEITRQTMQNIRTSTTTYNYAREVAGGSETGLGSLANSYQCTPGGNGTSVRAPSPGWNGLVANAGETGMDSRVYALEIFSRGWWFNSDRASQDFTPAQDTQAIRLIRLSNGLYSFVMIRRDRGETQYQYTYLPEAGTPGGQVVLEEMTALSDSLQSTNPVPHGSYNPITGQAARAFNPVCWT
jgi:hypothetical protein